MKKFIGVSITILTVLCLAAVNFSTVFAFFDPVQKPAWGEPIPVSNGKGITFTSNVLSVWQLPGTITLASGMIVPAGFPNNEEQFGGKGIKVSGIPEGKSIQICFDFPTYNNSWKGKIYEWDGSKWVAVTTSVLTPAERDPMACTYSAGNGVFALIMGYYGPVEPIFVEPEV